MTTSVNFYNTGTLTVTNNSAAVTGSGTAWVANANAGQLLMVINGTRIDFCPIQSINSDTGITLQSNYVGGSGSTAYPGLAYMIVPVQGYQQAVFNQLATLYSLITSYTSLAPNAGDFLQYLGSPVVPTTRSALQVLKALFTSYSEASVASASSCTLFGSSVLSPRVQLTGTTTINYFDQVANCVVDARVSGSSLTITNSAGSVPTNFSAISCPGAVNLVLAAGDRIRIETDSSGAATITRVHRANGTFVGAGTALLSATVNANANALPAGASGTIFQIGNADGTATRALIDAFGTSTGAHLNLRTARGTNASKSAVQSGDVLGVVSAFGYGATGYSANARAYLQFLAGENWSDSAQGAYADLYTTPNGGTSTALVARFFGSGHLAIGGTTDSAMLTVNGTGQFNDTLYLRYTAASAHTALAITTADTSSSSPLSLTMGYNSANYGWNIKVNNNSGSFAAGTWELQRGNGSSYVDVLSFTDSGNATFAGNATFGGNVTIDSAILITNTNTAPSAGTGTIFANANTFCFYGNGAVDDFEVRNSAGTTVFEILHNSTTAKFSGLLYINQSTSTGFSEQVGVTSNGNCSLALKNTGGAGTYPLALWNNATSSTIYLATFWYNTSVTQVGSVTTNGSTTAYNTSSGEFRPDGSVFKQNIRALDATLAWQVLEGFAPQTYNVANDDDPRHGFVVNRAHNKLHHHKLHAMGLYVEPDAKGHGGAMDYGKMTPFISAAVLDLRSHLDTHEQEISRLKERVAQLEAERKAA